MKAKKLIVAPLVLALVAATCSKNDVLTNAQFVLDSFHDAAPLIAQLAPQATARLNAALSVAQKLKDAIAASETGTALDLLTSVISISQQIVNDDLKNLTEANRSKIMAALALSNIALHFIVSRLKQQPGVKAMPSPVLAAFDREDMWGNRYKR
jgi:hypothetical protein